MDNLAESFTYAISSIVSYNGHGAWLMNLVEVLESEYAKGKFLPNPLPVDMWGSEEHCIWMILVGMFGCWGTSIRSGWIEDAPGAAKFIREVCKDEMEDMERDPKTGWKYKEEQNG